jgi:hypothetical protein
MVERNPFSTIKVCACVILVTNFKCAENMRRREDKDG